MPVRKWNSFHAEDSGPACADLWRSMEALTRRQVLGAGTLAVTGLSLPALFSKQAQAAPAPTGGSASGFGQARACIVIFQ